MRLVPEPVIAAGRTWMRDLTPAGDRSYLGHYGLIGNPWAVWLLGRQSEMLADDARLFSRSRIVPPDCPQHGLASVPMHWRPGAFKCYYHEPPFEIRIEPRFEPAPDFDALGSLDKMLDYRWDNDRRRYVVVEMADD